VDREGWSGREKVKETTEEIAQMATVVLSLFVLLYVVSGIVMGINVFEQPGEGNYLVGSFRGSVSGILTRAG